MIQSLVRSNIHSLVSLLSLEPKLRDQRINYTTVAFHILEPLATQVVTLNTELQLTEIQSGAVYEGALFAIRNIH